MRTTNKILMDVTRPRILCCLERFTERLIRDALRPVFAIRRWNRVRKDSKALNEMSDHLLKDIGLTREDLHYIRRKDTW